MRHEYSLAHLTVLSLAPPQLVDVAARTGYEYVGVRITRVTPDEVLYDLARDRALMRETKARLADTGVAVLDVELFRMDPALEPEHFLPELDATAELGAQHIIAQLPDPDRERATARFARLCDLAPQRGIFVSLEFPHWTETGTLAEAARVVRAVNRSNAGILVDMLHFGRSRFEPGRAREVAARMVPLRARLRRGDRGAADDGGDHPHRARRAAVPGRRRHPRPRDPCADAAGHSVRAGDSANGARRKRSAPRRSLGSRSRWRRAISTIRREIGAPRPSPARSPRPRRRSLTEPRARELRMTRIVDGTSKCMRVFIALCMLGMVVLVFGNVVLRYAFNSGITVSEELSRWLFVWLVFVGAVVALRDHAHLGMDSVVSRLPAWGKKACFLLSNAADAGLRVAVLRRERGSRR